MVVELYIIIVSWGFRLARRCPRHVIPHDQILLHNRDLPFFRPVTRLKSMYDTSDTYFY